MPYFDQSIIFKFIEEQYKLFKHKIVLFKP